MSEITDEMTCLVCGSKKPRVKGKQWCLCSRECRLKRKMDYYRKVHPLDNSPVTCRWCGKEFVPASFVRYKQRYCSPKCKAKGYADSVKRFLILHPDYNKNRTPYYREHRKKTKWGGNWWKALERDSHACQICGSTKKVLVHHLDNEGEKRGCNHLMENLVTLCWDCHKGVHGVSLVRLSGQWFITGKIFNRMGITVSPPLFLP